MAKILKQGVKFITDTNIEIENPYLIIDSFGGFKSSEGNYGNLVVKIYKDKETREEAKINRDIQPIKIERHHFEFTINSFEQGYEAISGKCEGQDAELDNKYPDWLDLK